MGDFSKKNLPCVFVKWLVGHLVHIARHISPVTFPVPGMFSSLCTSEKDNHVIGRVSWAAWKDLYYQSQKLCEHNC